MLLLLSLLIIVCLCVKINNWRQRDPGKMNGTFIGFTRSHLTTCLYVHIEMEALNLWFGQPYQQYSWPTPVTINDDGTIEEDIPAINSHNFQFTMLPENDGCKNGKYVPMFI